MYDYIGLVIVNGDRAISRIQSFKLDVAMELETTLPQPTNAGVLAPRYLIHNKDREHSAAMSLLSNQKEEVWPSFVGLRFLGAWSGFRTFPMAADVQP